MALPRHGMSLVTQYADVRLRDFPTDLSLSGTAAVPVLSGEFFFLDKASNGKLVRIDSGQLNHAVADNECAAAPGFCCFQQQGAYDVQAIRPGGRIVVIWTGPFEADFQVFDHDDFANMTVGKRVFVRRSDTAKLDTQPRGLLGRTAEDGGAGSSLAGDIIAGWVTKNAVSGGSVRVYCPNSFAQRA